MYSWAPKDAPLRSQNFDIVAQIFGAKHSSLFFSSVRDKEKKFYKIENLS
jgi:hypothetical protein